MSESGRRIFIDTPTEADAIQKAAASLGVTIQQVKIVGQRKLASGLIRYELIEDQLQGATSIEELLERADFQLSSIESKQFIKGYSTSDLEEKGLLNEVEEVESHSGKFSRRCGSFNIAPGIEFCECEAIKVQDLQWLTSMQSVPTCPRGAVIATWAESNTTGTTKAIGVMHFTPPVAEDATMILLRNRERTVEFIACYAGKVLIYNNQLYLLPIDIPGQIADFDLSNPMKARCGFIPPFGKGRALTLDLVLTFLSYNKVKFGIHHERIEKALGICNTRMEEVPNVCIAEGMEKINGKHAVMKRQFDNKIGVEEFQISADGTIDYRRKIIIPSAKKDELLAQVTLPTSGQPGMDVFGNMILADPGNPLPMAAGEGVYTSADGREFYAARVGQVNYGPDAVSVFPVFEVSGDVDAHCGNVEFDGNVIVHGSISSGFSVKAKGNIEVQGDIQGAVVEAGRDLIVSGGIIGAPNIVVKVGRNLVARHLHNAVVEVEGDVHIRNSCMYSVVETTGQFYCIDGQGVVMGGTIFAMRGGRVKEAGSETGVKTLVICGQDFMIQKKVKEAKRMYESVQEDMKKLDVYLMPLLQKIQDHMADISPEQRAKVSALVSYRKRLNTNLTVLASRIRRLVENATIPDDVRFHVYKHVHPGTVVQICGQSWAPTKDFERVVILKDQKTGAVKHLSESHPE